MASYVRRISTNMIEPVPHLDEPWSVPGADPRLDWNIAEWVWSSTGGPTVYITIQGRKTRKIARSEPWNIIKGELLIMKRSTGVKAHFRWHTRPETACRRRYAVIKGQHRTPAAQSKSPVSCISYVMPIRERGEIYGERADERDVVGEIRRLIASDREIVRVSESKYDIECMSESV